MINLDWVQEWMGAEMGILTVFDYLVQLWPQQNNTQGKLCTFTGLIQVQQHDSTHMMWRCLNNKNSPCNLSLSAWETVIYALLFWTLQCFQPWCSFLIIFSVSWCCYRQVLFIYNIWLTKSGKDSKYPPHSMQFQPHACESQYMHHP